MKMTLTQAVILNRLTIDVRPQMTPAGHVEFVSNPKRQEYYVFDNHRDAPVGFGVRVTATKKTYIIQRRVRSGHRPDGAEAIAGRQVIKAKIGNVSDFTTIDAAREKARALVEVMKESKRNPNEMARERDAAEMTIGQAFAAYRSDLLARPTPATPNTLEVYDKALKRLDEWKDRRVRDLTGDDVLAKFDAIAAKGRTAAEQTFRWANVVAKAAIASEKNNASSQNRAPTLTHNPFTVLTMKKRFRSRAELENEYKAKGVRNPLTDETLGKWFTALFARRTANRTGCDYLILTTLWGTRREEALPLVWRDKISDEEARKCSFVDLANRRVFFHDTKNRQSHELPLADGAFEILKQRHDLSRAEVRVERQRWVFPARARSSKVGHYTDMRTLFDFVREDAGIARLSMHDLRRTFGRFADLHTSYAVVKRLLNHGRHSDPTSRYTEVEEKRLAEVMQNLEVLMLETSPALHKSLYAGKRVPLPTKSSSSGSKKKGKGKKK